MKEINMPEKIKIKSTRPDGVHHTFTLPRYMACPVIKAVLKDTYDMVDVILNRKFVVYNKACMLDALHTVHEVADISMLDIDVVEIRPLKEQEPVKNIANALIGKFGNMNIRLIF